MASGTVLLLAGVLLLAQITRGNALQRLKVLS